MAEFVKIETQEQFDAAIGERIKRERETLEKKYSEKYSGYISPDDFAAKSKEYDEKIGNLNKTLTTANEKISGFDKQIAERDAKIKAYESHSVKTRIAHETGLSYDAVEFIKGDDEESIRKSAQSLKALFGGGNPAPLADNDRTPASTSAAAYKKLAAGLTNND